MRLLRAVSLSLFAVLMVIAPATAVTKSLSVAPMTLIVSPASDIMPMGIRVRGSVIYLYGGAAGTGNMDGVVRALDAKGATLWSTVLDSGGDEIVTAATLDAAGQLWLVGISSPSPASPSATSAPAPISVLNPDSVLLDPNAALRKDLTTLVLWNVDPAGNVVSRTGIDLERSFIARSIVATSDGVAIAGEIATTSGSAGFCLFAGRSGAFADLAIIGKSETEINSISRLGDNYLLVGSSTEKILGKPVIGKRDGILLTIAPDGKFLSVVRSSSATSSRSWRFATPSFFLGGDGITNGISEAVVTKFSAKLLPSWTARFPSAGPALVVDGPLLRYAVFPSTSTIKGIKGWNPSKAAVIALGLDSKGVAQAAFSAKSVATPIALGYSNQLGLVVLARSGQNTVSLFHALTR